MNETFTRARHQLVARRCDMILRSRNSLSLVETKAVLYAISKVQPHDTKDKLYDFDCNEFYNLINWKKRSYVTLKAMLKRIADQSWWINETDDPRLGKLCRWFDIVNIEKDKRGERHVTIRFHETLFPYILNLHEQYQEAGYYYMTYQFQYVALMDHVYGIRLYDILKTYGRNNNSWVFEFGTFKDNDIQMMIASLKFPEQSKRSGSTSDMILTKLPKSWDIWTFFERDVLIPAKDNINKYTDLKIDYQPMKTDLHGHTSRRVIAIRFFMLDKTEGEKDETEAVIDKTYEQLFVYRQMELKDYQSGIDIGRTFYQKHEERLAMEEEEKSEERINISNYKIAASMFREFTERELDRLMIAAYAQMPAGQIDFGNREMWAVDYIDHYYKKIEDTPDETKTTPFRRLLNLLDNDYDDFALQIHEYDKKPSVKSEIDEINEQILALQRRRDELSGLAILQET